MRKARLQGLLRDLRSRVKGGWVDEQNWGVWGGREEMVRAVVDRGLSKAEAARQFNTSWKTVDKWVAGARRNR